MKQTRKTGVASSICSTSGFFSRAFLASSASKRSASGPWMPPYFAPQFKVCCPEPTFQQIWGDQIELVKSE